MRIIRRTLFSLLLAAACHASGWAQENQSYFLHTVEKGQSLYSIASMYGISQSDIIKINPGSEQKIIIGHSLRIPRSAANTGTETFHTIQQGETLYRVSVKYNLSAKAICDANPGLSAANFRTGQVIRIPSAQLQDATAISDQLAAGNGIPGAVESRCRDMHRVKRKETLFSISRQYKITPDELIAANPELKKKPTLQKGSLLCIPYAQAKAATEQANEAMTGGAAPTNTQLFSENKKQSKRMNTIRAGVLLPFLDGISKNEQSRMVEYYEGLLLAVDSLKRTGTSIDLYTYNTGTEKTSIDALLRKEELKEMDVIFGPLHPQHVKPLAEFAQKNNTRLVVPFTAKDDAVFRNPAVYQINTPQSYLHSEVYDHFTRQFPNANIIFIESAQKDKEEFIKGLKEQLAEGSYTQQSVSEEAMMEELKTKLDPNRENIFLPTSDSNLTLIKILPQLTLLVRDQPEAKIHLFGYPKWQTYTKDHLEAFFLLDTYFYSSFYTNNLLPAAIQFTKSYRRWYGKDMEERYPKYGMLGFDTAYFFLKGLSRYGSDFEERMSQIDVTAIQTGFKFQRVNNWGGFINKKVFFVHFTRDFELVKLDFD